MSVSDETVVKHETGASEPRSLALAVSPLGAIRLERAAADDAAPVDAAVAGRIERAFEAGAGHGLLHLGLAEVETALPPSLAFFRDLARLFVTRLCRVPDLEEQRERVVVPSGGEDLDGLARAVPPMTGAEYVSVEALERAWRRSRRRSAPRSQRTRARSRATSGAATRSGTSSAASAST
jgi:hypothetical protein